MNIIGVPFNSAGRCDEEARAPGALRSAGLLRRLRAAIDPEEVTDHGDVRVGRPDPDRDAERDPDSGLLAAQSWARTTTATREAVGGVVTPDARTLVLGGDCSILPGCLAGAQDAVGERMGLLFVDGHEDAWPPWRSDSGEAADCELGLMLGRHREHLPVPLSRDIPVLDDDAVALLGPRDGGEIAAAGVPSLAERVPLVTDDRLTADDGAPARHAAEAVRLVEAAVDHWWLHVDLDVLASHALPAVDYPQAGGLEWAHLRALVTTALRAPGCRGTTLCIYDPDLDPAGLHAATIVDHLAGSLADASMSPGGAQ